MASPWVAKHPVMFPDGSPWVSQHTEREAGCALEGGAVWPGLLEPPYFMGPGYSILRISDLWPGHSHWVWTWEWDRWRENRNKPIRPAQRTVRGHMMIRQRGWEHRTMEQGHQKAVPGQTREEKC